MAMQSAYAPPMTVPAAALPDLDSLRCFLAAVERHTFRAAAADVGLSPAAFSERISRLEDLLGARLFAREGRRIQVTPAGQRLLPEARRTVEAARRCVLAIGDRGRRAAFSLIIGTRYELGLSWLVPLLTHLQDLQPERTLHLNFGQHADLMQSLRAGLVHAVVTSGRLAEAGLEYAPLHAEDYVLVGRPGQSNRLESVADASDHVLIDASPALPLFRYLLDGIGSGDEWQWGGLRYIGTIAAIRQLVLEGAGVAVLPRYFVQSDLDDGRLERLMPEAPLRADAFRLVWRSGAPQDASLRELGAQLRSCPLR